MPQMARIAIYIGRHLCTAPRTCKEADALGAAGHEVTVHGLWSNPQLVSRDRLLLAGRPWTFIPYADCSRGTLGGRAQWWLLRLQHRLARESFVRLNRVMANALGYGTSLLASHALTNAADLSIFHSEGGLWAAQQLRRRGRAVGVDFEDWYSRDLSAAQRVGRPVLEMARLEAAALLRDRYLTATSQAMAEALVATYGGMTPVAIYNTFPCGDRPVSRLHVAGPISLHWYSQILGPGRGLESLFAALPHVPGAWRLHLRGDDPHRYAPRLLSALPLELRDRVRIEPTVPNAELPLRIAEHDIGLALEVRHIPSRDLTITNKLFEYLHAGLAVVVSNTAGHREVFSQAPGAGDVFEAEDPMSLSRVLAALIAHPERLAQAKQAARDASRTVFAHQRQLPLYAELAARALGHV